ncbi:MAG: hypothetical protein EON87_22120 [Brevundimonas sp.]|nr:MAG: hypothetical protein EON87_22120 [Brevundimonas sp.]
MFNAGYIKSRLGHYGAAWLLGFLLTGAAILVGLFFADFIVATDLILPVALGLLSLALGISLVSTMISRQTLGTKLAILLLAILLVLPLLWAPVSAAVCIAFFMDRSIEYSTAYAGFQIGISRVIYPATVALFGGGLVQSAWAAFQVVSSIVGFIATVANLLPRLRRLLGPEPGEVTEDAG